MSKNRPLLICMASSESLPYAKSGGLADVVGALPKALAGMGCAVHLFHPLYRSVRDRFPRLEKSIDHLNVETVDGLGKVTVFEHRPSPGVTVHLISCDPYFDRDGLYGDQDGDYPDNLERFSFFSRAILAAALHLRLRPHIFHLHDWQTGLVPLYLKHRPDLAGPLGKVPSLITIHNLAYQGLFPPDGLGAAGIPGSLYTMEGVEFYGRINLLKGGILYADAVSTVSRKYSREIRTAEFGAGLEDVLRLREDNLHGILNGVDYEVWNPVNDPHLPASYSIENLSGKSRCKDEILKIFDLPPDTGEPLLATISRIIDQKGFDIVAEALPSLFNLGFRYVLLGTGERRYRDLFSDMARRYPERMSVKYAYDESLAHRIEAGADFFLMPSRFEPCGLNQIYSLRYGTIPIVRATGGLDDTITGYNPLTGAGNGLKFDEYSADALAAKCHEAALLYSRPQFLDQVMATAMSADFSWETSARAYLGLYRNLLKGEIALD
jgi:starch synthase